MKRAVYLVLVVGFVILDWMRFHDFNKPGEVLTTADWLTGFLSLLVFYLAIDSLMKIGGPTNPR